MTARQDTPDSLTLLDVQRHARALAAGPRLDGAALCGRVVKRLMADGLLKNPLAIPEHRYAELLPDWGRAYLHSLAQRAELPASLVLAVDTLMPIDNIDLGRYCAVGDYVTSDPVFRDRIATVCSEIRQWHDGADHRPIRYMLCGEPGGGKSYLVRQITEHSIPDAEYIEESASDHASTRDLVQAVLSRLAASSCSSASVFVDEVDTELGGTFLYSDLYHLMEGVPPRWCGSPPDLSRVCWFFAASSAVDFDRLRDRLRSLPPHAKGADFLDRVPAANRLVIPPINTGPMERVVRGVSCLCHEMPNLKRVEGLALCYLASQRFESTRGLALLLSRSCSARSVGSEQFMWDHLSVDWREKRRYVSQFYSTIEPVAARMWPVHKA